MKKAAEKDSEFLAAIRQLPCLACASFPSEAHHIKTRGSGGDDSWWNVIPLCSAHHTGNQGWHYLGWRTFVRRFPHIEKHLKNLGWNTNSNRLWHPTDSVTYQESAE